MNLLILQHVPFEGPAAIKVWAERCGHSIHHHCCAENQQYPSLHTFDALIVMGGPMGVNDELAWLNPELEFITNAIHEQKYVLGICLGAQLIAKALGAKVTKNVQREIGWYPVKLTPTEIAANSWIAQALPACFIPLHWHGDTFDLPNGATHLYHSEICKNQAYIYNNCVIGLQFHLEFDIETTMRVAEACRDELNEGGAFVQSEKDITVNNQKFKIANQLMYNLLNALQQQFKRRNT